MKLIKDNKVVGFGILRDNLFKFELDHTYECNALTLKYKKTGTRCIINENSSRHGTKD